MASALKPPSLSLTRDSHFFLMSCRGSESHEVPSTEKACNSKATSSSGFSLSSAQRGRGISLRVSQPKVNLPPRVCTLREFGEGVVSVRPDETVSDFFESLSANIEFSAEVQDWEVFSGRLAMMVFASALVLEAVTGDSVFEKLDSERLLEYCAAIVVSSLVAAGLAVALQAKTHVAYTVSRGYEKLINGLIDNVIDSILFDSEDF